MQRTGCQQLSAAEPRQAWLESAAGICEVTTRIIAIGWVRSHESPGATRHSIHGSDVSASRPRATAAMRRRFRGAAICGTCALIASEPARPTGAGRFAGTKERKPKARDGASSARAWPTSLTTKCRHHGASICVTHPLHARARLVLADEKTAEYSEHVADGLGRGLAERLAWHHDEEPGGSEPLRPIPCRGTGCGQVSQRRAYVGAGRCHAVAGAVLRRQEGTNFLDHRWGRIRRWRSPDTSGLDPRPPRPGAWRRRPALCKTDRQQSYLFGPVSPARAKTRHNGRPICGCRTSRNEVLPLIAGPRTTSMTYWEEEG